MDDEEFIIDKEFDGLGKMRKNRDDDEVTEEDPDIKISRGNSQLMKDKELYGKDEDFIRRSKGAEIPDLKASKKPVYRANDPKLRPINDS